MTLLVVSEVSKTYVGRRDMLGRPSTRVTAVDRVSFTMEAGSSLALVGESGAGKSTVGRLVLRLVRPDTGTVRFDGVDVTTLKAGDLRRLRRRMQMIFQDPYSSLDPRMTILDAVGEALVVHGSDSAAERSDKSRSMLERVGIGNRYLTRYPGELSGGQLQRVAIARALMLNPDLIVCDEPVAALDVSVQAQVLNLMKDLQQEFGLSYLFITHNLSLVPVVADHVAVMRAGAIIEMGPTAEVFADPQEGYTQDLLRAVPIPVPRSQRVS